MRLSGVQAPSPITTAAAANSVSAAWSPCLACALVYVARNGAALHVDVSDRYSLMMRRGVVMAEVLDSRRDTVPSLDPRVRSSARAWIGT
ncbi:MAG: hypothetical protein H7099_00775 [Gemmatimonadaceae bacterium]|nr:hypothetical protein [Gemmatimonadaceae bacterium]